MSTKPFKDIEQMMRDAAEGFEQPFDEDAWRKMELLLDQEKQPRRHLAWLWWLLPAVLLIGTSLFIYNREFGSEVNSNVDVPDVVPPTRSRSNAAAGNLQGADKITDIKSQSPARQTAPIEPLDRDDINRSGVPGMPAAQTTHHTAVGHSPSKINRKKPAGMHDKPVPAPDDAKTAYSTSGKLKTSINTSEPSADNADVQSKEGAKPPIAVIQNNSPNEAALPLAQTADTVTERNLVKQTKASDKQKSAYSRWYLIAASGIESSGMKLLSTDKVTSKTGVLIGYQLGYKLSLQTGFLASRKKYVAGPADYYFKSGSYWSTVDIKSVDANCLVYEIPLDLRYDFHPSSKSLRLFATAGLSSYIMRKEDYNYTYNRYGYTRTAAANYRGNRHLISVVRFGGGAEQRMTKNFSVHVSPMLSIPLAGVGEGKVKLYSAEMLLGIRYSLTKKERKP